MKTIITAWLLLVLAACSSSGLVQSTPSATAFPTGAAAVTQTQPALPPGETGTAQSVSEWRDIPIMPGAIAGEGDEEGYVFTIKAVPAQVQAYYQMELGNRGWQLSSRDESGSSMTLIFTDSSSATLTVSILSKGDEALVLLVK